MEVKWRRTISPDLEAQPEGFDLAHLRCPDARLTKANISARQRATTRAGLR